MPAGAPTTEQARCPRCQAFIAEEGAPCQNRLCPSNRAGEVVPLCPPDGPRSRRPRPAIPPGYQVAKATWQSPTGGRICGTRVTFPDGYQVDFADRMPKGEAIGQAQRQRDRVVGRLIQACEAAKTALKPVMMGDAEDDMREVLAAAIGRRDLTGLRQAAAAAQELADGLLGEAELDCSLEGQQTWGWVREGLRLALSQAEGLLRPPAPPAEPAPPAAPYAPGQAVAAGSLAEMPEPPSPVGAEPSGAAAPAPGSMMDLFGPVIYAYTRAQAIEDGLLVDVSETAREAGFRWPVALTRAVWDMVEQIPESKRGLQDEAGRLWDVLWMASLAARNAQPGQERVLYQLLMDRQGTRKRLLQLAIQIGGAAPDDPQPCITIMLPEED